MVLEDKIDWQKRRREIIERLEKEEKDRIDKIEKAKRLQRSWELTIRCREIIKENHIKWIERDEEREKEEKERKRQEQIKKAEHKKAAYIEKEKVKKTNKKITEMLKSIPDVESTRIEKEIRRQEKQELSII